MRPQLVILASERTIHLDLTYGIKGTYDPDKMNQVILNLFQNTVQHTDSKDGEITITLHTIGNGTELVNMVELV